jgi:hypothetical protein
MQSLNTKGVCVVEDPLIDCQANGDSVKSVDPREEGNADWQRPEEWLGLLKWNGQRTVRIQVNGWSAEQKIKAEMNYRLRYIIKSNFVLGKWTVISTSKQTTSHCYLTFQRGQK